MHYLTIYPDGRVKIHGTVPEDTILMAISRDMIAIKHPGGNYSDNGGVHYASAWIDVKEIEVMKKLDNGEIFVETKRSGKNLRFHPTPKKAQAKASNDLLRLFEE